MSTALYPLGLVPTGLQGAYSPGAGGGGDVTAPVLSSPSGTSAGLYSATGSVTTDTGEGVLYYLANTSPAATSAEVKAGSSQPVTATGVQSINLTGLSASTGYYVHYLHTDASANDSAVATSAQFFTDTPAPVSGSIDLSNAVAHVLKNNTGAVYASVAYRCTVVNYSTGALVAIKTGTTTAGGLVGVLSDAAIVAGTDYWVIVEPGASGAYGIYRATAS